MKGLEQIQELTKDLGELQKQVKKIGDIVKDNVKKSDEIKTAGKSYTAHQISNGMVITCDDWSDRDYEAIKALINKK